MAKGQTSVQAHRYEFGGPVGAAFITFGLPFFCYLVAFTCNDVTGCPAPSLLHPTSLTLQKLKNDVGWPGFAGLINQKAIVATLGYYVLSLVLNVVLPAQEVEGVELRSGGRLKYRFNAFSSALFIMVIAAAGTLAEGPNFVLWTFIYDNYVQLLTTNILISYALATYVYIDSFSVKPKDPHHRELAAGGQTGNMMYDWFIGRELNPRVKIPLAGVIDIKTFMELRPGMLAWVILDLTFMAKQYANYGYITDSIMLVTFSQALYTFDALWWESSMLTMIDITTDGFGFMLAFGDLVWVPFTYSLQARYLAVHPVKLGLQGVLAVVGVQLFGYYIFRAANNEKNTFRTNPNDPSVKHLKYIQTSTGSKLITSGWWGRARHINYLGDWIMSWAYCLPTGIAGYIVQRQSFVDGNVLGAAFGDKEVVQGEARGWGMLITYFFMLYFAVLLIHREMRDEEKCRKKYGKDWDEYCKRVPWRILPGVY
ncbi:ergosterol biosynthesis ERG4/ERG24 [Cryomyces antarcticus]